MVATRARLYRGVRVAQAYRLDDLSDAGIDDGYHFPEIERGSVLVFFAAIYGRAKNLLADYSAGLVLPTSSCASSQAIIHARTPGGVHRPAFLV